jgi:hypothetical protein
MSSQATELVSGRVEPLKSSIEVLKSGTEPLKNRTAQLLNHGFERAKKHGAVMLEVCEQKLVHDWGTAIVNTTFGLLMGGLVLVLILIHAGVPIVSQ